MTKVAIPEVGFMPPKPKKLRGPIAVVGCGAIVKHHLDAYVHCGYDVVALCDLERGRAAAYQAAYFPNADVYTDYRAVLARKDISIVDVATHPTERVPIIEACIAAGKHVLSQKPFVIDVGVGERLCAAAEKGGVSLAVNQNARWAPHFNYMRQAVARGVIGDVQSVQIALHFDHNWTADTPFNEIHHLLLYDFCIHWFDMLTRLAPNESPKTVFANLRRASGQTADPPLVGSIQVAFDNVVASMFFDGSTAHGRHARTVVSGSKGTLESFGPNYDHQTVRLHTTAGVWQPPLEGMWFTNGFQGTMSELLCGIEEQRTPDNAAESTLPGLSLCFAAIASAESGRPVDVGSVRALPGA